MAACARGGFALRTVIISVVILTSQVILISCHDQSTRGGTMPINSTSIVAGSGEQTFEEKYGIEVPLPMAENEFLALVRRLGLSYSVCGERGTANPLPSPRQRTTVDLGEASKCYDIDGSVDPIQHIGERYRAFLNPDRQVIYIENTYSYTGP